MKEAIKIELSQRGSQYSPPTEADIDIQQLGARVSPEETNAETVVTSLSREERVANVIPTMGLYVQRDHCTHLVALGKIYEVAGVESLSHLLLRQFYKIVLVLVS